MMYQSATGDLNATELWLIWRQGEAVGYAIAYEQETILIVTDLLLSDDIDPASTIAALTEQSSAEYVQVMLKHQGPVGSLREAGYEVAEPHWATFMIKPLSDDSSVEEARQLFRFGTPQFLISWLDHT